MPHHRHLGEGRHLPGLVPGHVGVQRQRLLKVVERGAAMGEALNSPQADVGNGVQRSMIQFAGDLRHLPQVVPRLVQPSTEEGNRRERLVAHRL